MGRVFEWDYDEFFILIGKVLFFVNMIFFKFVVVYLVLILIVCILCSMVLFFVKIVEFWIISIMFYFIKCIVVFNLMIIIVIYKNLNCFFLMFCLFFSCDFDSNIIKYIFYIYLVIVLK